MQDLLVVVDMQNDFVNGSLGSQEAKNIVPNVVAKCENYAYTRYREIVFTKDTHCQNYLNSFEGRNLPIEHCIKGTYGWDIIEPLQKFIRNNNSNVIEKPTFAYMNWAQVIDTICDEKGMSIHSIELCGLCTDICVISNALVLRGLYHDMEIVVDSNSCAGVTPEKHKAALEVMKSCQIEVI